MHVGEQEDTKDHGYHVPLREDKAVRERFVSKVSCVTDWLKGTKSRAGSNILECVA